MGFAKLREWVGTVTGKGVSWGRDSVGRSEPAFMAASTPTLPPLTCTARGRLRHRQLLFAARPANCGPFVCFEACAGRKVRRLCPPAVNCSAGFVFACHPLPAMPTALISSCPRSVCFAPVHFTSVCFPPVHFHVRQDRRFRASSLLLGPAVCEQRTVPLAAATRACSGGASDGSI